MRWFLLVPLFTAAAFSAEMDLAAWANRWRGTLEYRKGIAAELKKLPEKDRLAIIPVLLESQHGGMIWQVCDYVESAYLTRDPIIDRPEFLALARRARDATSEDARFKVNKVLYSFGDPTALKQIQADIDVAADRERLRLVESYVREELPGWLELAYANINNPDVGYAEICLSALRHCKTSASMMRTRNILFELLNDQRLDSSKRLVCDSAAMILVNNYYRTFLVANPGSARNQDEISATKFREWIKAHAATAGRRLPQNVARITRVVEFASGI